MTIFNPKIEDIILTPKIGLDTEFNSLDVKSANCLVISISNENHDTFVLDRKLYSQKELVSLVEKLSKLDKIICHNTKVDIGILYSNFGILLKNGWCTMLASQIIDNGLTQTKNMVGNIPNLDKAHSLVTTIKRYLGVEFSSMESKKDLQRSFWGLKLGSDLTKEQLEYAGRDTVYLLELYHAQQAYIKSRTLQSIIKLENRLTPVLIKIEFKGCLIDVNKHKKNINLWESELEQVITKMDAEIHRLGDEYETIRGGKYANPRRKEVVAQLDMFGGEAVLFQNENKYNVNYSSSRQIDDLFTKLELPKPIDDKGKVSYGEDPLNFYLTTYPDTPLKEFLKLLLKYRELSKLIETYGAKFLEALDEDGRLRTNYGQCFTDTGRLTSSEVVRHILGANLANIPKNKDMRSIFIPDPGYSFIDSDFTGQELVLAGDYSEEPVLIKAFQEGFDHHSFLASISYSIIFKQQVEIKNSTEEITIDNYTYKLKKLRDDHKAALFSLIYLGGKKRIMNILNEYLVNHVKPQQREEIAQQIVFALHKALPKLIKFLKGKVTEVQRNGFVVANKLGRRRYFDEPDKAYGDAANFPIQGSGADCIKISLIKIDEWIEETSKKLGIKEEEFGWITMTIYDQNLVCINDKYIEEYSKQIPIIMGESITYFLKILKGTSDYNVRKHWSK
jgi:DNA polymerase I-like protein with 3'-5' exonuclease and polymerase domains